MTKKYRIALLTAIAVAIADQLTKWYVVSHFVLGETLPVVPGYFDLTYVLNPGAAFGMLAGWDHALRPMFFFGIALAACVLLWFFLRDLKPSEKLMPFALGLLYGGIIGNVIDRVRSGAVVDFLSAHWRDEVLQFSAFGRNFHIPLEWPAFNIADSAITVAVVLLLWSTMRGHSAHKG